MSTVATPLRLNLGCWIFKRNSDADREQGWVDVDLNPKYEPDVVSDVCNLPYSYNQVDEIYAGHILEHVSDGILALQEWWRVLKPGGAIAVVVPDIERAVTLWRDGGCTREFLNDVAFGGADERATLQMHQRIYTEDILLGEMQAVGFKNLEVVTDAGILWQVGVRGIK